LGWQLKISLINFLAAKNIFLKSVYPISSRVFQGEVPVINNNSDFK